MSEASGWTPARLALLREYWAAGLSATNIAKRMGGFEDCDDGGRHAVLSKVYQFREAAKKKKDEKETKFWTRSKSSPPKGGGMRSRKNAPSKAATRAHALRPVDSVPTVRVEWPNDDEVRAAWIKQLVAVK